MRSLLSLIFAAAAACSATAANSPDTTTVPDTTTTDTSHTPNPGTIDTIFYEGFESGNFSQWPDGYDASIHHIVTNAAGAVAGSRYLDVTYAQGHDGGFLNTWFMPGYDSVYVRAYFKVESAWSGATKFLALYGNRTDNMWSAFGQAGVCPSGTDFFAAMIITEPGSSSSGQTPPLRFYTYYPDMNSAGGCYGNYGDGSETYNTPLEMSTGTWHKLEFWLKINTVGQRNAVQRFWLDGRLKAEWSGIRLRTSNILRINALQLTFSVCCGGSPRTQHSYVDEILVTNVKPQ